MGVSAEAFDEVFGRNFGALIRGDYDAHAKLTAENPSTMRDIQALQDADDHIAVLKTSLQKQFSDAELKNILGSAYRELGLNLISDQEADSDSKKWEQARIVAAELNQTFGVGVIEAAKGVSAAEHGKGLRLLQNILGQLPPEKIRRKFFQPRIGEWSVRSDGVIVFDANGSKEDLKKWLMNNG